MKPTVKFVTRKEQLRLTGFTDIWSIPTAFMDKLKAKGIIARYNVEAERGDKHTLVISLAGSGLPMDMLRRLAEEVSKAVNGQMPTTSGSAEAGQLTWKRPFTYSTSSSVSTEGRRAVVCAFAGRVSNGGRQATPAAHHSLTH